MCPLKICLLKLFVAPSKGRDFEQRGGTSVLLGKAGHGAYREPDGCCRSSALASDTSRSKPVS
jgi:hypothetical protein